MKALLPRLRETFLSPRRLFRGFGEEAPWLDVLLISTAVAALTWALQPGDVFLEQMRHPVTRMGEPVVLSSPPAEIVRFGRWNAVLSALVGHPVLAFSIAGVLTLVFTVAGGGAAGFRQYLAVAAHALLIPAAGSLLALAAAAAGAAAPWSGGWSAGEALVPRTLAALDPFVLWMLIVTGVGVEQLDRRRSLGGATALLLLLYLAVSVARAAGS